MSMKILRINNPIPIQSDVDLLKQPFTFEYDWTNVDGKFINFNQSYLELTLYNNADPHTIPEHLTNTKTDTDDINGVATNLYWGNYLYPVPRVGVNSELVVWKSKADATTAWDKTRRITFTLKNTVLLTQHELICLCLEQLQQDTNTYALIDSTDVEMVYGLPDGSERALKYHETSLYSSRARKMIILKDVPKYELEKSMYGECLYTPKENVNTLKYIIRQENQKLTLAIPLYLISGLGVDGDSLNLVKHMKLTFRTAPLITLLKNNQKLYVQQYNQFDNTTQSATASLDLTLPTIWNFFYANFFDSILLKSANIQLMTYQNVNFNQEELYKTIPTYIQIDYRYDLIKNKYFNINRAIPFIPEYILFYFTEDWDVNRISNIPSPYIWPTYLSCLVGDIQMFPQTEFPTQKYHNNVLNNGKVNDALEIYHYNCPNKSLYSLWADNSHPETALNFDNWMKHPIFVIPCKSLMNVSSHQGIELNFDCNLEANKVIKTYSDNSNIETDALSGYISKHAGITRTINQEISDTHRYTIHMVAVRSTRDI
ncbi:hypothetical protein WA158_006917 [Blastocystis sp. Blastoise]